MVFAFSTASFMAAVNAPPQYSDQESVKVTEKWTAGEKERAAFMNASPDEVGKLPYVAYNVQQSYIQATCIE